MDKKIISQIEFYFGDINLPRDKFMLEQIKLDDGWIPMSTMLKFQRLAKLTTDQSLIISALNKSNLIEVDETRGSEPCIRRSPEFPIPELNEERRLALQERTVYMKKFPLDSTLDDIMSAVSEYGPIDNIIMRKYKDRVTKNYLFKGSVFLVFPTKESAEKFVNLESFKIGEEESIRKFQVQYAADKKKEILEVKLARVAARKEGNKPAKQQREVRSFPKGAVFRLSGDFTNVTRDKIKKALNTLDITPAYVDFIMGAKEAFVRMNEENSACETVKKIGDNLTVDGSNLTPKILEGEEEENYLKKASGDRDAKFKKCKSSHAFGRKNKGKGGKIKRKVDDGGNGYPTESKISKTDD